MSQLYPTIRQDFATKNFDWTANTVKILLMDVGFVPDFTKQFRSDIPAGNVIATSANITGRTATLGYCDGDTVGFGVISDPRLAASLVFFEDTGTPSTSRLIAYFDPATLPGLPAVLSGLDYFVYQNLNFGGWFRL
jgi:hypothetical protein